jgi:mevalonate kinase
MGTITTSAPGKVILLGEHAVVFGQPAISLAIDLRLQLRMRPGHHNSLNGHPLSDRTHPYIVHSIKHLWTGGALELETVSAFPSGSGLGSSAAVTTATLAALMSASGKEMSQESIARHAFEVESEVQGRASPIDTSTVTHGEGILIGKAPGPDLLWHISRDVREWYIHHCSVPRMTLVVGFTGISSPTGPQVAKVRRYVEHSGFAREVVEEIGSLTNEGLRCLRDQDMVGLGELMTRDHKLLAILGVSCGALDRLVEAALPYSYGAKLTGSGGGGSMIALTDRPEQVAEAIRNKGGTPFIVHTGVPGVKKEII